MRLIPGRFLALALAALTIARAWPHMPVIGAVAIVDSVGLLLIWVPARIDEWTFGLYMRGGTVSSHTPSWMIAAFGWALLLLMSVLLFWPGLMSRGQG